MEQTKEYKSFTDLEVWQLARAYKQDIYILVRSFPATEKYKLEDQLIRASRSVAANIAEGYGRFTYKDQLHFCIQARGSLYETMNHIVDANDCKYISEETLKEYRQKAAGVDRKLCGYMSWLKTMINPK